MADRIKSLREKAMRLPLQPGVYIMKDKSDHVIYVGKAKALKNTLIFLHRFDLLFAYAF